MSSLLYVDAFSGVAGDMLLAAMVDLGVDAIWLGEQLHRLPVGDFSLTFTPVTDRGLTGQQLRLEFPAQSVYRHFSSIVDIIEAANLSSFVSSKSVHAFSLIAEAEARVHGCTPADVHFHEVGALDTLIDIVGFFLALENLGRPSVACSPLPMPNGKLEMSHGLYPLPAPAVPNLLRGFHVFGINDTVELVTPTGAAILAAVASPVDRWPTMQITGCGLGAGTPGRGSLPNLVRLVLGETATCSSEVVVIETQVDDMNPELLAYTGERLLEAGALDYFITPIYMKKSRPGFLVTVLTSTHLREQLIQLLLAETTTLGVRFYPVSREMVPRQLVSVATAYGLVQIKAADLPGGKIRIAPEFEDCVRLAREHGVPLWTVYDAAIQAFHASHPVNP